MLIVQNAKETLLYNLKMIFYVIRESPKINIFEIINRLLMTHFI